MPTGERCLLQGLSGLGRGGKSSRVGERGVLQVNGVKTDTIISRVYDAKVNGRFICNSNSELDTLEVVCANRTRLMSDGVLILYINT